MTFFRVIATSALIGAATLSAMPAMAATMDVTPEHSSIFGDAAGQNAMRIRASYEMGGQSRVKVQAGAFRVIGTEENGDTHKFLAFCLSPFEWLRLPLEYTVGTDLSATVVNRLSALANGAWDKIVSATAAGAFQLAAWEIVSESKGTPLSLATGDFRVTWVSHTGAATLAQTWLDSVQNNTFQANPHQITILSADNTQDLLTADLPAPVPLPAGAGLLAMALSTLLAASRKRSV